jgi:hypothetical protein
LAVDQPDDLERMRWITAQLPSPVSADFDEVVTLARSYRAP